MNRHLVSLVAALAVGAANLRAISISETGVADGDEVSLWRTASFAKQFDADKNNIYGSLGYVVFTPISPDGDIVNEPCMEHRFFSPYDDTRSLPEAVSIVPVAGSRQNFKYAEIDDPGKAGGRIRCGSLTVPRDGENRIDSGNENLMALTFNKPGVYRIGALVDHMQSRDFTADAFGLWNRKTGPVLVHIERNAKPKWVFFDVSVNEEDIGSGDNLCCLYASFELGSGYATVGAVSIDEVR